MVPKTTKHEFVDFSLALKSVYFLISNMSLFIAFYGQLLKIIQEMPQWSLCTNQKPDSILLPVADGRPMSLFIAFNYVNLYNIFLSED